MKLLLITLITLFSANAFALDQCYSGAWYEPATSGEGIDLQVSDEKIVLYRYAYLNGKPNYWVTSLPNTDTDTYQFRANQTLKSDGVIDVYDVGTITLKTSEGRLMMSWNYDINIQQSAAGGSIWCLSGECSGSKELIRLFQPVACK